MALSLTHSIAGAYSVIAAAGDLDLLTSGALRDAIESLVNTGHPDLVVDLDAVEFIDSSGLGVLAGGVKRVRAHRGSMALVCSNRRTLNLLRISGVDRVLPRPPRPRIHPGTLQARRS